MAKKLINTLTSQFNPEVNQNSPLCDDFVPVIKYDEDGAAIVTHEKVDYETLSKSLGKADDWSLTNLLKAGINPNFPIHTAAGVSRMESVSDVQSTLAEIDAIFPAEEPKIEE